MVLGNNTAVQCAKRETYLNIAWRFSFIGFFLVLEVYPKKFQALKTTLWTTKVHALSHVVRNQVGYC